MNTIEMTKKTKTDKLVRQLPVEQALLVSMLPAGDEEEKDPIIDRKCPIFL